VLEEKAEDVEVEEAVKEVKEEVQAKE